MLSFVIYSYIYIFTDITENLIVEINYRNDYRKRLQRIIRKGNIETFGISYPTAY